MTKLKSETWQSGHQTLTICDKCSELLNHSVYNNALTTEIRVESCPDCMKTAKKIIRDLLDCPDLNLDNLEEETIRQIDKATKWLLKEN